MGFNLTIIAAKEWMRDYTTYSCAYVITYPLPLHLMGLDTLPIDNLFFSFS